MDSKEEIIHFIKSYFAARAKFNGIDVRRFWYPEGKMFLVGNQGTFRIVTNEKQAEHIQKTNEKRPELKVDFVLDEIEQVQVHDDLIATVHVRYRMIFPEGYGQHRSFINMAKIDGTWMIVNAVDRGLEVSPDDLR